MAGPPRAMRRVMVLIAGQRISHIATISTITDPARGLEDRYGGSMAGATPADAWKIIAADPIFRGR